MSNGRQGEAVGGLAALTTNVATRARSASLSSITPIKPSLHVHSAIVRRGSSGNHVQVIPR